MYVRLIAGSLALLSATTALSRAQSPAQRAAATEARMTDEERVVLTIGMMPLPIIPGARIPAEAIPGAGYVPGISRLSVPALFETDASLGVSWVSGVRGPEGATALPSGLAMASSWNPALIRRGGAMIGAEAKAKGFNVLLAGGVNLMRDPRNGRNFEYFGEDPLLSGILAGEAISGIQSNNMIATVKHFALNGQETGRKYVDSQISESAARESDLLAFQIAIERGNPGAVMCAYNRVNGPHACDNGWLLNRVLKQDWAYPGFVMSDWGAVPALSTALNGLDQQSGWQLDRTMHFGDNLRVAASQDPAYAARLRDMNRRILHSIYSNNLDSDPPERRPIDQEAGARVAEEVARQGIVLLRNERSALPLAAQARRIAVIGGYADTGVLSGGGSSQVHTDGGPAAFLPFGGEGPFSGFIGEAYQRSNPLSAIRAKAPQAEIVFRTGSYVADAVEAARSADVAIVFATQWTSEGFDVPDLSLPRGQDALIAAVAEANPNTIVVLETGGPVLMPWLNRTAAVLQAWYPGSRGGQAIASVLFGETNPSGRLPVTFPASLDQLPRPVLDGHNLEPNFLGEPAIPGATLSVNYDIEGSDVGYRWHAARRRTPLFPFGHGLSYTTFERSALQVGLNNASLTIANTGARAGADVAQVYLVSTPSGRRRRLVAFDRVELRPGERKRVELTLDPRLLAEWEGGQWRLAPGEYQFAIGENAETLGTPVTVRLTSRSWRDGLRRVR